MDAEYADEIVVLANTPTQAESLLHSLKQAASSIGLHIKADKIKYTSFNQSDDISTINGTSQKLGESSSASESASHLQNMTSISD